MYEQQTTDIDTRSAIFETITAEVTTLVNTIQNNVTAMTSLKLQAEANADIAEGGGGSTPITYTGIVVEGDSISAGTGDNTDPWPAQFARATNIPTNNVATPGDTLYYLDLNYGLSDGTGASYTPTYNTLVLGSAGTNDINQGTSLTNIQNYLISFCNKCHATGFVKVFVATITPRNWSIDKENVRLAFNSWLLANWATFAEGIIDMASSITTSDLFDGLHPNNAGSTKMAATAQAALQTTPQQKLIYIGPENRWAPTDAVFVPYSNRANLQSILNSNKKVELEGVNYNVAITMPNGGEMYGISGRTTITSMTLAQDASNVVFKGIGADVIIPANSGDHRACAMGAAINMGVTSEGTIHDSLFFRTFQSQIWMKNSASGRHYNLRFFNPQTHGAGVFDGQSALQFQGRPDFSSYNIAVVGGNHLTPVSSCGDSSFVDELNFICGGMERDDQNPTNNKPTYLFTDCGTVRVRSLSGYDPVTPAPLGLTRVKNAEVVNFVLGTPKPVKFNFDNVDNLLFLPSIDGDRMVDNGLPGTPSKLRIKAQWSGNGPNGISYNGTFPAQLTGSDITAAMNFVVEDVHQYKPWATVTERAVPDMLGPNWQAVAAANPDMTAELQTLLDAAGENGVAKLTKIYYCANTINLPLGCALIGSGNTTSGVVMKSQAIDMFQHNWSGGNVFRDLTFQGGKTFLASIHAAQQYTGGFFQYCIIRDQAEAAIDLRYTYGWDNNYFEGCNFVNCGVMFRSQGRTSGTSGGVPGEDIEMSYSDKSIYMRCQFIGVDYIAQLRPKRQTGGFIYFECFVGYTKKGVFDLPSNVGEFQFINCYIKNCKATVGERILFNYQGSPDLCMDYIGTTIENPDAAYLWHPGSKYEGVTIIKGNFTGKAFRPTPDSDPRDSPITTIENSDFDVVPSGISTASIASGTSAHSSFIIINSRLAATEDAALAGAISVLAYNSKGTPDQGDDVIVKQLNWLPGTPRPTSKITRDRI